MPFFFPSNTTQLQKPLNYVAVYKHWLSDDWLLFFFLRCLSWKCASFLPPLQISALSELGVMGQQTETGPAVSLDYIKRTPDAAAGRQAGTVKLCSALSPSIIKKTDLERAALQRCWCQAGGKGCKPTFSLLFVSVFVCFRLEWALYSGWDKIRISELMSTGNCIIIHLQSSLGAGQLQNRVHAIFWWKGYFQRMKTDLPPNLCVIKEHNNETSFSLWFPPCSFLTFSRAVFCLNDLWMKRKRQGNMCDSCCIHLIHAAISHSVTSVFRTGTLGINEWFFSKNTVKFNVNRRANNRKMCTFKICYFLEYWLMNWNLHSLTFAHNISSWNANMSELNKTRQELNQTKLN